MTKIQEYELTTIALEHRDAGALSVANAAQHSTRNAEISA